MTGFIIMEKNMLSTSLKFWLTIILVVCTCLLAACATKTWQHDAIGSVPYESRAKTIVADDLRVTAAVPNESETETIFGLPLYKRGIQPVWLEIENRSSFLIRYAPVGTDRNYFSPLEVSYMHRSGYSDKAREQMDRYFHEIAMPRLIRPGETRSGFVFTHAQPGTKGFNVDLFGPDPEQDYSFSFFVDVPGFEPDHASVDFDALYTEDEIRSLDSASLRQELAEFPCCSKDSSGDEDGAPVNAMLIGESNDVLYALLRANWHETVSNSDATPGQVNDASTFYLYGRQADALFYHDHADERVELLLWLSPLQHDGKSVWMGQVNNYISNKLGDLSMDPQVDDATLYLLQNIWYSQSLLRYASSKGPGTVSIDKMREDFRGAQYFTTGYRVVIWVSSEPVSLLDAVNEVWDRPVF
jgi:hypothetical protein